MRLMVIRHVERFYCWCQGWSNPKVGLPAQTQSWDVSLLNREQWRQWTFSWWWMGADNAGVIRWAADVCVNNYMTTRAKPSKTGAWRINIGPIVCEWQDNVLSKRHRLWLLITPHLIRARQQRRAVLIVHSINVQKGIWRLHVGSTF